MNELSWYMYLSNTDKNMQAFVVLCVCVLAFVCMCVHACVCVCDVA